MDSETGERLRDSETGEFLPRLNLETGEIEFNFDVPIRRPFKIPKMYMKEEEDAEEIADAAQLKKIKMSPIILFLLPTVFFVPVVAIILGCIEIVVHLWAHRKNKTLVNKDIYYQSPLHIIVSEFCACCIDESMKNKISRMQDRRKSRFMRNSAECLKRIV